jgi:flavin reductase (DIM6/NTAB) family NADH-FMN oxidoreductase RutF
MLSTTGMSAKNYHRLLSPRVVALVTALRCDKKPNTMVAAWHSPVSTRPPILAVAISPLRYTHELILTASEFTVCIPPKSMLKQVEEAGAVSGREVDKSAIFNYMPAQKVRAPVIKGSLGTIECTLNSAVKVGDHSVIFGNVINSTSEAMGDVWEVSPLLHVGSNYYAEFTLLNKIS